MFMSTTCNCNLRRAGSALLCSDWAPDRPMRCSENATELAYIVIHADQGIDIALIVVQQNTVNSCA